jgi:hypothetical protein
LYFNEDFKGNYFVFTVNFILNLNFDVINKLLEESSARRWWIYNGKYTATVGNVPDPADSSLNKVQLSKMYFCLALDPKVLR